MKYEEYLSCAKKHLDGCYSLFRNYQPNPLTDGYVWLEIFYLSGYIIEGITVYSAYKLNGWPRNVDIKKPNLAFTQRTGLDFYYKRDNNDPYYQTRNYMDLSVQGHRYKEIVERLLKPNPSFYGIPYFGDGEIDINIKSLFDKWCPEVRYTYNEKQFDLNQTIVNKLIITCSQIYNKHI